MKLISLPNIGKILEGRLVEAGVDSVEKLIALGSKTAFMKMVEIDSEVCISVIYSLEGAIQGIRWHDLDRRKREELKKFYFAWRDPE
ncbi:MAG: TfoX/Sxy family protein [Candidatus Stygibacter australis]|nr:TfoX/Sxy family protein [Candidatus Stygibacter australis]MDP8321358.1 TfoX/Sxy family protein [Candidatus Stygibacter australis]